MNRTRIINYLIKLYRYKNYLEIGVRERNNFNRIIIDNKDGVDPIGNCNYPITSDEFFKKNKNFYDIIFIDGLHKDAQVMRDITNSLLFLNKNGTIVLHDCNPIRESHQSEEYITKRGVGKGTWNGTVWKAFARLRSIRNDLYMTVVNCDHGVGIIKIGSQKPLNLKEEDINYKFFQKRREEILNLISPEKFLEKFKS